MKNLENLGLTEICANQLTTINGGDWWDDVVDAVEEVIETVEDFFEGIQDTLPTDDYMF